MSDLAFAVVPEKKSTRAPSPCIFIVENGTLREVDEQERKYLEEKFHPADGVRPYSKLGFYQELRMVS
jgi:hypothetical protein